jgi:large subunit ribosomal protein L3
MIEFLIGKKLGMTQIFQEDGKAEQVTVLELGPCTVVQVKNPEKDNYSAVQLGYDQREGEKGFNKPMLGHFKKYGVKPHRMLREFPLTEESADLKPGTVLSLKDMPEVEKVTVTGISKGKGFQGVVRRYGFRGGRKTHGSNFHRAPGSIGASAWPSRVIKGKRMPGRMGTDRVSVKGLQVIKRDPEKNILAVRGAVPGHNGSYIVVKFA